MEVDLDACLRSFRDAFQLFKSHPSEEQMKNLEREGNVLVGIGKMNGEIFLDYDVNKLLHADALSVFVNIFSEMNLKEAIYEASISLLIRLASSSKIRKSLQDTFKLTSTLLNFITQQKIASDSSIVLQSLHLLQQVTYGIKIENCFGEFSILIQYLVSKIILPESQITLACLGTLANLCRNNAVVKDYIKNMSNVKMFFKSVASFLSHSNWMNIIFALSIFSISLDEPLGEKVFNKKNIDQTFLLIFNVLLNGDNDDTCRYSCDLLIGLLQSTKLQQYLAGYADLRNHVKELVVKLTLVDEESCEKILELFICLNCVPTLLANIFLEEEGASEKRVDYKDCDGSYLSVIFNLAAKQASSRFRVASLALKLIKIIYQDNKSSHCSVSELVPILIQNIKLIEDSCPGSLEDIFGCSRRSIDILQILCCEDKVLEFLNGCLNSQIIYRLLTTINSTFSLAFTSEYNLNDDQRLEISSVFVGLAELLFQSVKHSRIGEDLYLKILQSPESSPFLACCLASQSIDLVQRSLKIIQRATQMPNFPVDVLSVTIARNNKQTDDRINVLQKQRIEESVHPFSKEILLPTEVSKQTERQCTYKDDPTAMAALADRISSELEIKDSPKFSEIMDIYEHKLAAVEAKGRQLQELLDAKTAVLSQSDRFLAQYRCRSAQSEAECLKLRSLLLESQKYSEKQQEHISDMEKEKRHFLQVEEEFKQLQKTHRDFKQRLETTQHNLDVAVKENISLSEMSAIAKKHNENLKSECESLSQNVKELEKEKKLTDELLTELEEKHKESLKLILSMKQDIKDKEAEVKDIEKKMKGIEKQLKQSERTRLDLSHKVTSSSVLIEKYEKEIKEKDIHITDLNSQLEKHSQIAAMIHNLSGGKVPSNALNFSS